MELQPLSSTFASFLPVFRTSYGLAEEAEQGGFHFRWDFLNAFEKDGHSRLCPVKDGQECPSYEAFLQLPVDLDLAHFRSNSATVPECSEFLRVIMPGRHPE